MDIPGTILELYARKRKLEQIIASLEELQVEDGAQGAMRRGRRSMSAEERAEVSRRMTRYWANRRKSKPETA